MRRKLAMDSTPTTSSGSRLSGAAIGPRTGVPRIQPFAGIYDRLAEVYDMPALQPALPSHDAQPLVDTRHADNDVMPDIGFAVGRHIVVRARSCRLSRADLYRF
jgi:hypothetical protein